MEVTKLVLQAIGVVLALGTLVWGAARLSQTTENLQSSVVNLNTVVGNLRDITTSSRIHQARQDVELETIKQRLDDIQRKQ
jgi:hypothetical protein